MKAKSNRKYQYACYAMYSGPYGDQGKIISRHTTYELAEKACKKYPGGFVGIQSIND